MRITTLAILFLLGCSPSLEEPCEIDGDCLIGEICTGGRCVRGERTADGVDDTPADGPSDVSEVTDPRDGDGDHEADDGAEREADMGEPGDCEGGVQFDHRFSLAPYLQCRAQDNPGACDQDYRNGGCSVRARANQLVELPLRAGMNDVAVAYYGSFDAVSDVRRNDGGGADEGDGYVLVTGGDGSVQRSDDGYWGGALHLDSGPFAFEPNPLGNATAWTIAFWVKACQEGQSGSSDADAGSDTDGANCGELPLTVFRLKHADGAILEFELDLDHTAVHYKKGTEEADDISLTRAADGVWHHIAFVRTQDGALTYFVDGSGLSADFDLPIFSEEDVFEVAVPTGPATAIIDEFIVARRAFRHPELATLMNGHTFGSALAGRFDFRDVRVAEQVDGEWVTIDQELVGPVPGALLNGMRGGCILDFDNWSEDIPEGDPDPAVRGCSADWRANHVAYADGRYLHHADTDESLRLLDESSYYATGLAPLLDWGETSFSVAGWFKLDGVGTLWSFGGSEDPLEVMLALKADDDGSSALEFSWGDNKLFSAPLETLDADRWHHIAVVVRDPEQSPGVVLYADGIEVLRVCDGEPDCRVTHGSAHLPLFIGSQVSPTFTGLVDDFTFIGEEIPAGQIGIQSYPPQPTLRFLLSTIEVDDHDICTEGYMYRDLALFYGSPEVAALQPVRHGECNGLISQCTGVLAWWRFDEGLGRVFHDLSSAARHGFLEGCDEIPEWGTGAPEHSGLRFLGDSCARYNGLLPGIEEGTRLAAELRLFPSADSEQVWLSYASEEEDQLAYQFGWRTDGPFLSFTTDSTASEVVLGSFWNEGLVLDTDFTYLGVAHTFGEGVSPTFMVDDQVSTPQSDTNADKLPVSGHHVVIGSDSFVGTIAEVRILTQPPDDSRLFQQFPYVDIVDLSEENGACLFPALVDE